MLKFSTALVILFSGNGHRVARKGWLSGNWHLKAAKKEDTGYKADVLNRVDPEGAMPWGVVTGADLLAADYVDLDDAAATDLSPTPGSFAEAAELLIAGKTVRRKSGKVSHVLLDSTDFGTKILALNLPNGAKAPWVPSPTDVAATDWEVVA